MAADVKAGVVGFAQIFGGSDTNGAGLSAPSTWVAIYFVAALVLLVLLARA